MPGGIAKGAVPGKGKPQYRSRSQRQVPLTKPGRAGSGEVETGSPTRWFADKIMRYFNKLAREP
jgi:hypothetical protein